MNRFSFVDCTSVNDALDQMNHGAIVKAGGIDLLDLMKDGIVAPSTLINIRQIKGLHGITVLPQGLTIGPLTTLAELAAHPDLQQTYRALSDAAGHAAAPQVRNMAPGGGNLMPPKCCWWFRSAEIPSLR